MAGVTLTIFRDNNGWHIRLSRRLKPRPFSTFAAIVEGALQQEGFTFQHTSGKNGWTITGKSTIPTPANDWPVEMVRHFSRKLAHLVPEWAEVRLSSPHREGDGRFSGLPGTDPHLYPERFSDKVPGIALDGLPSEVRMAHGRFTGLPFSEKGAPTEGAPEGTKPAVVEGRALSRGKKAGRPTRVSPSMGAGVEALRRELAAAERDVKSAEATAKAANQSWCTAIERRDQLKVALAKLES